MAKASTPTPERLESMLHRNYEPSLVSVVIPAYNCAPYIAETLRSIASQDHTRIEIIVVDDGSTDNTIQVIEDIRGQLQIEVRIITQANGGAARARNAGIEASRGEFVAFMDADDYWFPEKISAQIGALRNFPDHGIVYCSWREWDGKLAPERVRSSADTDVPMSEVDSAESGWLFTRLLMSCIVWTSAVMARREVLDAVGRFDPRFRRGQDYDYWIRASQHTRILKLARVMALYRILSDSISRRPHTENFEALVLQQAIRSYGRVSTDGSRLAWSDWTRRLSSVWYYFGAGQVHFANYRHAVHAALFAVLYCPWQLRSWALLIESMARLAGACLRTAPRWIR